MRIGYDQDREDSVLKKRILAIGIVFLFLVSAVKAEIASARSFAAFSSIRAAVTKLIRDSMSETTTQMTASGTQILITAATADSIFSFSGSGSGSAGVSGVAPDSFSAFAFSAFALIFTVPITFPKYQTF